MTSFDLAQEIFDKAAYENAVKHLRDARVVLPTFAELADPTSIAASIMAAADGISADEPHSAEIQAAFRRLGLSGIVPRCLQSHNEVQIDII